MSAWAACWSPVSRHLRASSSSVSRSSTGYLLMRERYCERLPWSALELLLEVGELARRCCAFFRGAEAAPERGALGLAVAVAVAAGAAAGAGGAGAGESLAGGWLGGASGCSLT